MKISGSISLLTADISEGEKEELIRMAQKYISGLQ